MIIETKIWDEKSTINGTSPEDIRKEFPKWKGKLCLFINEDGDVSQIETEHDYPYMNEGLTFEESIKRILNPIPVEPLE